MTDVQWKTLFAAVSAVCAFLIAQPDVVLPPIAKVALGACIVALSVMNPSRESLGR